MKTYLSRSRLQTRDWGVWLLVAVGLTMWFWLDLWLGGGLIGGDVYSYYLPQKAYYAEALGRGELPVWNPLVGHGYPLIAESQTGVFYPPTRLLYGCFDLNTAYNINHLLHYVAAFLATMLLARELGLRTGASLAAGLIYVYGWFAPRCCWEWAIITGTYLPLALWFGLRILRRNDTWAIGGLSVTLGLQLLAGHFNLAFITLLSLFGLTVLSLWETCPICLASSKGKRTQPLASTQPETSPEATTTKGWSACWKPPIGVMSAVLLGLLLSGIQLVPSWELKQQSQREPSRLISDLSHPEARADFPADSSLRREFNPAVGHLPPVYLSQIVFPWLWYGEMGELTARLNQPSPLSLGVETNPVEAHLYFSLMGLVLAVVGGVAILRNRADGPTRELLWLGGLGLCGLVFALGWLLPVVGNWPGFGFFRGPGRYTILTSLAVGLWAGRGWQAVSQRLPSRWTGIVWSVLFLGMLLDFSWVSQRITYTYMVPATPISQREHSAVGQLLRERNPPARLFAPGPNLPSLTGVAATPVYLGLGPRAYFEPALMLPERPPGEPEPPFGVAPTPEQIDWLRRSGVTHILGFGPPDPSRPELRLVWAGQDPLLNPAWGRREPLYLSELLGTRDRAAWLTPVESSPATKTTAVDSGDPDQQEFLADRTGIEWQSARSDRIELEVTTPVTRTLVLTELYDPNWHLFVNDEPRETMLIEGMYRGVELSAGTQHVVWQYRSRGLAVGFWLSVAGITILLILFGLSFICRKNALTREIPSS